MKMRPYDIGRVVVRAPTWVGDAVMSVPALRELRELLPATNITVAAQPGTAEVFLDADFVDHVMLIEPTFLASVGQLRCGKFDLALLFQNAFAAAARAFVARIRFRIGYATDRRAQLLTTALPPPAWKDERHESYYYLNIVAELERMLFRSSRISEVEPRVELTVSDERRHQAQILLRQREISPDRPLALLCPGSVNSRAKRWPAERYAELSDRLSESGMTVVLIGSSAEAEISNEVRGRARHAPTVLTGQTTMSQVLGLISVADVLVTNDTGPAHIGSALGTPTLVIFGPTNPLTTYPMAANAEIIREPPDCAPCMLRDCPIDHRCMTAVSVAEVFRRATAMTRRTAGQVIGS